MKSDARTVDAYLAALPEDRRAALSAVRGTILAHLPRGYEEVMSWGMICYEVPLATCPDTYNGKPLLYAALASQRAHMSVYLMNAYGMPALRRRLEDGFRAAGKRLDAGASCVRFRKLADLPLPVLGEIIAATPVADFVAYAEGVKKRPPRGK